MNELLKSMHGPEIAHLGINFLGKSQFSKFLDVEEGMEFKTGPDVVYNPNYSYQARDIACALNSAGTNYRRFRFYVDMEPGDNVMRIYGADYWNGWSDVQIESIAQQGRTRTNSYLTYKSDRKKKVAVYAYFHSSYNGDFRLYMTSNGVERQLHCEDQVSLGFGWNMGMAITGVTNYSGTWYSREVLADVEALLLRNQQHMDRATMIDREEQEWFYDMSREEKLVRMAGYIRIPDNFKIKLKIDTGLGTLVTIGDESYAWKNNADWHPWKGAFVDLSDKKPGELLKFSALMMGTKHSGNRVPIRIYVSTDGINYSERRAVPGVLFHRDEQILKPAFIDRVISSSNVVIGETRLNSSVTDRDVEIVLNAEGYDIFGSNTNRSSDGRSIPSGAVQIISVIQGEETVLGNMLLGNYSVSLPEGTEQVIIRGRYTGTYNGTWVAFTSIGLYKSSEWRSFVDEVTPKTELTHFTSI